MHEKKRHSYKLHPHSLQAHDLFHGPLEVSHIKCSKSVIEVEIFVIHKTNDLRVRRQGFKAFNICVACVFRELTAWVSMLTGIRK